MSTVADFRRSGGGRQMYWWMALVAAALVFAGFARTFYLKAWFGTPLLPALVLVHGVVMSTWFIVFASQVWLVESHRIRLHRRLGLFGAALVTTIPILGVAVAIKGARDHAGPPQIPPLIFLSIPLFDILVFACIAGTGLLLRRHRDIHIRLMLLATLGILPAAIARIPLDFILRGGPLAFFGLTDLIILACVAIDTLRHRRLHPAFGWGAAAIIVSHPLRLMLAGTPLWMGFANWLVN